MSFHAAHPFAQAPLDGPAETPLLSQSRLYGDVLRALGREVVEIGLGPGGSLGVVRAILRRIGPLGQIALIPGGPLWHGDPDASARRAALAVLPAQMRRHDIRALLANCADPADAALLQTLGHLPLVTGQHLAHLDLALPAAARRARLHGKWRNRLVQAESAGIRIRHAPFDPLRHAALLSQENAQRRARRYRGPPVAFAAQAAQLFPDRTRLFTATARGTPLGAMLFLIHGASASYHIGHLAPAGRHCAAHNLLLWQACGWLAEQGVTRLDLGPIDTETGAGLARFKLGSGARAVPLGATCLYTRLTAPLARLAQWISRSASRAAATQTGPSCR